MNAKEIFEKAKSLISEHKLYFIEDVVSYLPISKTTFYEYYKLGSYEMNELKDLLGANRVATKVKLRKKWEDSESAALQIGLMKLISTEEEAHRLNGTKREQKISGEIDINPKAWTE